MKNALQFEQSRKFKRTVVILCFVFAFSAVAAEQKIATIDYLKVFHGYWRTKQGDANLKEQIADLEKERMRMSDQFQKAEENYKKLMDAANDLALAVAERDKRKKEAESQLLEMRELDARLRQFDNSSRAMLAEKRQRMRENILQEIRDTIKAKVKGAGYTLVIDSSGETLNGTPNVLFNAGMEDITETVLSQLNINPPATAPPRNATPDQNPNK